MICLASATAAVVLAAGSFTLSWMHSIEHIRWDEDWRVSQGPAPTLALDESRVRGSGAGMDPPDGAVLSQGVWHHRPQPELRVPELHLSLSPYAGAYWLCASGRCRTVSDWLYRDAPEDRTQKRRKAEFVTLRPLEPQTERPASCAPLPAES